MIFMMFSRKNYEFAYKLFCLLEPLSLAPGCLLPSCYVHTNLYIATHPMHFQTCLDMLHADMVACGAAGSRAHPKLHVMFCLYELRTFCAGTSTILNHPQPMYLVNVPCSRSVPHSLLKLLYLPFFVPFFPVNQAPLPLPTCESATGMATLVSDCCHFGLQITGEDS